MFVAHTEFRDSLVNAVENKIPFCATSIGDSELAVASHPEWVNIPIYNYLLKVSGITGNVSELKKALINSIPNNDFIFAHKDITEETPGYTPYHLMVSDMLEYFNYDVPLINTKYRYRLFTSGEFFNTFRGKNVLLIGNSAYKVPVAWNTQFFKDNYSLFGFDRIKIVGTVPCSIRNPYDEINDIIKNAMRYDFDIALVGAGTCANVICSYLKNEGRVALDIGWVMDALAGHPPRREDLMNLQKGSGTKVPREMYA